MTIKRQACAKHPERNAIGVCVITRQPICAECSTRYEGVNYSKEGLRILQERRASAPRKGLAWARAAAWFAALASPGLVFLVYLFYTFTFEALLNLLRVEMN